MPFCTAFGHQVHPGTQQTQLRKPPLSSQARGFLGSGDSVVLARLPGWVRRPQPDQPSGGRQEDPPPRAASSPLCLVTSSEEQVESPCPEAVLRREV